MRWILAGMSALMLLSGLGRPSAEPLQAPSPSFKLQLSLSTDRPAYTPGQTVNLALMLTNPTDSPLILSFPSSHQYDFLILRGDQAVWRWSHERLFAQALTQLALMPHETRAIRARWDQKDPDGNQVPFGAYKALGQILAKEKTYTATTSLSIVRPPPEDQAK